MSDAGDRAPGARRPRRREPLRAAPEPAVGAAPPADAGVARRSWRDRAGALAALALVIVVALVVLVAASGDPDGPTGDRIAIQPVDVTARTETSAPRVEGASTGNPQPAGDGDALEPLEPGGDLDAITITDGVPSTGGYTDLIRTYFGARTVEAIVIVQCESGFDPNAVGTNTNGTQDHGLFQINDVHMRTFEAVIGHPWSSIYDPQLNTAFAAWLHDHAGGWGPWRCNRHLEAFQTEPDGDAEPGASSGE